MIQLDELQQNEEQFEENYKPLPQAGPGESDLTFFGAVGKAIEATAPFQQTLKFPVIDREVDEEYQKRFYETTYKNLLPEERDTIDSAGGVLNEQQTNALLNRVQNDKQLQQDLYEYGGFTGSIGLQVGASIFNPVEWGITIGTLGAGRAIATAKTFQNVMQKYKKTSAIGLGATEGLTAGYLSETIRQETGGFTNYEDRVDVALLGSVFGGTLGASGWFKALNGLHPDQQTRIAEAFEKDTDIFYSDLEGKSFVRNKSVGSAGSIGVEQKYDIDDFDDIPMTKTNAFGWASPRDMAYRVKSFTYRNILERLAPSTSALRDSEGNFVTQGNNSAWHIKGVEYGGAKGKLVNGYSSVYSKMNAAREAEGMPKLSEEEFAAEAHRVRIDSTIQIREHLAEIDYLKQQLTKPDVDKEAIKTEIKQLENSIPEVQYKDDFAKELNENMDQYFMYMENELRRPKIEKEIKELETQIDELQAQGKEADKQIEKLTELQNWQPRDYKGYAPRIYNKDAITVDRSKIDVLIRALQNSPTAKAIIKRGTQKEIDEYMAKQVEVAKGMVKKIRVAEDTNSLRDLTGSDGAGGSAIASGGSLAGRTIDVDERLLGDLVETDMNTVLDFYHQDVSGKLAIRKSFQDEEIDTWKDFRDKYAGSMSEEFAISGVNPDEALTNLRVVFEDIRGTDSIIKNPNSFWQRLTRGLMMANNIKFGPGFPVTALNELGPTINMGGVKSLSFFGKATEAALNKITNKEVGVEFINELQGFGIGIDIQHSGVIQRYTEGNHFFEHNNVLNKMRKVENAVFRYGGLVVMTDIMKSMLAGGFTARVLNMAKRVKNGGNLSTTEKGILSRISFTEEDLIKLSDQPIRYDADGLLQEFNVKEWDAELADKWGKALYTVTKGNILEPTSMDIPKFMSDPNKPLNSLLFQYYRFPFAAQSSLLNKAINENDKGALLGALISSGITASVEYAKALAAVKILELAGVEADNPFDDITNDGDQQWKLASIVASKLPYLGVIPSAVNLGAFVGGYDIPGTSYSPRDPYSTLAGASIGNIVNLGKALGDGRDLAEWSVTQLPRVPFVYDLAKGIVDE